MTAAPKPDIKFDINFALADDISLDAVERGVRAATQEADSILVDLLSQPGQGRVYTHQFFTDKQGRLRQGGLREGGPHRASAPGDPPAVDSGDLRRNRSQEVFRTPVGARGVLALNMEYAAALELGTEKVEPRPSIGIIPSVYGKRLLDVFKTYARLRG